MHEKCKRIGIFGGTFDPIHFGHLIIAEELREVFKLDKVIFIPSGTPSHKDLQKVSNSEHRYNMVRIAIEKNPYFELSRLELDRNGNTYTIDTIRQLKGIYPTETELFFIIGADVVPELITWKQYEDLFLECEFIAVKRPDLNIGKFLNDIDYLVSTYSVKINTAEVSLIEISSTSIRERVKTNRSVKYMLPEGVESYIIEKKLYLKL